MEDLKKYKSTASHHIKGALTNMKTIEINIWNVKETVHFCLGKHSFKNMKTLCMSQAKRMSCDNVIKYFLIEINDNLYNQISVDRLTPYIESVVNKSSFKD